MFDLQFVNISHSQNSIPILLFFFSSLHFIFNFSNTTTVFFVFLFLFIFLSLFNDEHFSINHYLLENKSHEQKNNNTNISFLYVPGECLDPIDCIIVTFSLMSSLCSERLILHEISFFLHTHTYLGSCLSLFSLHIRALCRCLAWTKSLVALTLSFGDLCQMALAVGNTINDRLSCSDTDMVICTMKSIFLSSIFTRSRMRSFCFE